MASGLLSTTRFAPLFVGIVPASRVAVDKSAARPPGGDEDPATHRAIHLSPVSSISPSCAKTVLSPTTDLQRAPIRSPLATIDVTPTRREQPAMARRDDLQRHAEKRPGKEREQ
jgi:hypothetical protein